MHFDTKPCCFGTTQTIPSCLVKYPPHAVVLLSLTNLGPVARLDIWKRGLTHPHMEMGNPRFLTGIKKNKSLFPFGDPHMKAGLGTSLNGQGESLFCGWKNLAKKFERILRLCMWKSCFLVKNLIFLPKRLIFLLKNPIFLSKKKNLDDFTVKLRVSHTC